MIPEWIDKNWQWSIIILIVLIGLMLIIVFL